ncbi:MAG TPA: ACR3 family arsenite efflux transporter [Candidatus Bathyarchaeia archaeon]|nr:ACR3 family arsenite efflux transporter [Candidatus Bathyarchaeia archaeon]
MGSIQEDMKLACSNAPAEEASLGVFEKYLTLWIAICIAIGLILGRFLPQLGQYLDKLKFGQISIPIGILLFLMMYPTVIGISFGDVKKATKFPKPMLITIIANWAIAPPLMFLLANFFLKGNPQFIAGALLLGISPCTAMVMWWIKLAKGDLGQGLVNTAINALLMVALYGVEAAFYLGRSDIPVPWELIAWSVILFIAVPVSLAALTRRIVLPRKGVEWFKARFQPALGKISIVALLTTLIVLFSLEGNTILAEPLIVALIAVPLLVHYAMMIAITYGATWFAGLDYRSSAPSILIGSSSHFEVAIAVATTLFGIGSGAALATVIGPLMEVPLMLTLVKFLWRTRNKFPRTRTAQP